LHVAKGKEKPQEDIYGGMSMRYSQIRNLDISNGLGVGVSLFVQGCPFHCKNCFNSDTWDFNGGKEWTEKTKNKFMELIDRPYIKRVSFLGGECLADQNLDEVLKLVQEIRISFPEKTIWLYTGFCWNDIMCSFAGLQADYVVLDKKDIEAWEKRKEIISNADVLVDGEYIDEQRDITLKWRGSSNQRVISVVDSLAQGKIVLYCD
jgi:anaerobic ribonucleoside-triphosphate reductase activating protein